MSDWHDAEHHVERAHAAFEAGRWEEAESELRAALSRDPYQPEWLFNLGLTLDAAGRHAEAADAFRTAFEVGGDTEAQSALMVGVSLLRDDRPREALEWFERAATLNPDEPEALVHRIDAHARLNEHEQAEVAFYLAQQIAPEHADAYAAMADSLLDRGEHERAIWCLREAARLDPELPRVHARLAEAYAATGRSERARQLYVVELRRDPGDVDVMLDLGSLLVEMHRLTEAEEKFRRVLELRPDHAGAHYELGELALKQGDHAAALRQFDVVVRLDPQFPGAQRRLADALLRRNGTGDGARARELLLADLRAHRAEPGRTHSDDLVDLGELLLDAARPDLAEPVFDEALARNPGDAELYHLRSVARLRCGRIEDGIADARAALERDAGLLAAMHNLALANLELGRWLRARYWVRRARQVDPDDPPLRRLRLKLRVRALAELARWMWRVTLGRRGAAPPA